MFAQRRAVQSCPHASCRLQPPGDSGVSGIGPGEGSPLQNLDGCGVPSPATSALATGVGADSSTGAGGGAEAVFLVGSGAGSGVGVGVGAGVGAGCRLRCGRRLGSGGGLRLRGCGPCGHRRGRRRGGLCRPGRCGRDDTGGLGDDLTGGRRGRCVRLRLGDHALSMLTCRRRWNADDGALLLRRERVERMSEAGGGLCAVG